MITDEPDIGEQAVDLVDVTYDEHDFVTSVSTSLIVNESFESAETFPDLDQVEDGREINETFQFNLRR